MSEKRPLKIRMYRAGMFHDSPADTLGVGYGEDTSVLDGIRAFLTDQHDKECTVLPENIGQKNTDSHQYMLVQPPLTELELPGLASLCESVGAVLYDNRVRSHRDTHQVVIAPDGCMTGQNLAT